MREVRKANWFFLFVICVFVGGSFGFAWLGSRVELPYNLRVMSGQILIGFSLIVYFVVTKTNPFKVIWHRRLGIIDILLVVLLMFLMLPMVYFINYVSMFFTENTTAATIGGMMDNPYLINLLMIALTPAIVEELVCRGVIFHAYKRKSLLAAVLLTAFIFGLLHMNLNQMLYAGVIGIVFAITVEATGSIYSSMIMHFIMNSISVTALAFLKLMKDIGLYSDEMLEMEMQQAQSGATLVVSPAITIVLLAVFFMVVIGATALAAGVVILLAKRSGRTENLKAMFKRRAMTESQDLPEEHSAEMRTAEATVKGIKGRIIDIPFVLAVAIAFAVMIFW